MVPTRSDLVKRLRFVSESDTRHSSKGAEHAQLTAEDIKLIGPGISAIRRRIEGDVLRMLDEDLLPVLKHEDEWSEWPLLEQPLYFGANGLRSHGGFLNRFPRFYHGAAKASASPSHFTSTT